MVNALVGLALLGTLATGFLSLFHSQTKATRHVASLSGSNEISHSLDVLLGASPCISSGTFLSAGAPATVVPGPPYSLQADTIAFPNGTPAITSLPDPLMQNLLQPAAVQSLTFKSLGDSGPYHGVYVAYPFLLTILFTNPQGTPPPALNKFVTVYANPPTAAVRPNQVVGMCDFNGNMNRTWVSAHVVGAFNFASPTGNYLIPFNSVAFDALGEFNAAAHTFQPRNSGIYTISLHASILTPGGGWQPNDYCKIWILQNGTQVHEASLTVHGVNGCEPGTSIAVPLAAGDVVQFNFEVTYPGALTLDSRAPYTNLSIVQTQ